MTTYYMLFRNISSSDDIHISDVDSSLPVPTIESTGWTNEGYSFVEWNTARDKSGDSYAPGSNVPQYFESVLYAIWEEVVTPDVTISYNGDTIASLSDSGTEVLETNGTYLIDDITVIYSRTTYAGEHHAESRLISFLMPDADTDCSCNAEPNMTFADWCASAYNVGFETRSWHVSGSQVVSGSWVLQLNGSNVLPTDTVQENATYGEFYDD